MVPGSDVISAPRTPDSAAGHGARAERVLSAVAVTLGVLIAAFVGLLAPAMALPLDPGLAGLEGQTILQRYGPALTMLTLLPALLAAAPAALPARARGAALAAVATMLTGLVSVPGDLGLYYFPLVLLLGAAAIVPALLRRGIGRVAARSWRLAGAAVLALPALLSLSAVVTGTFGTDWRGVVVWIAGPLVLAALCACGIRRAFAATALTGAVVMVLGALDQGFLFAGFWLFGAVYLMIGAGGFIAGRPVRPDPSGGGRPR